MALVSEATRERIRASSDIVDVIGTHVPLKRAGANFTALCPFHKEKTPSFNVNPQRQTFYCFGCHKGGDVFSFVELYENVDFPEALKRLADRARIPLEFEQNPLQRQAVALKDQLLEIHEQITVRWQNALATEAAGELGRQYLAQRKVSPEGVTLFRIGCAPPAWDDTVNWARSKGYNLETVEKAGLILQKDGRHYDRFRGRLMFPICDEQGRVVGFSGRVLTDEEKTAKYVNSPETPIFTKSKVFFGLDKSKRAILDAGHAIICEGQLDLIACYMAGIKNIVAPQGTAFTADHARIIKRYTDEVVLCFDSDNAGQNAAARALDSLLAAGLAIKVATIPAPHDPDSFIREHGGDGFKQLIEKAQGFFDFYLNRLCQQHQVDTDKGRLTVLREMAEAVYKTANSVLIDTYAQKTALRLGVKPEAVRLEFKKVSQTSRAVYEDEEADSEQPQEESAPPSALETALLKILLLHEDSVEWAAERLHPEWIAHPLVRTLAQQRIAAHANHSWLGIASFFQSVESVPGKLLIAELTIEDRPMPNPAQQLSDVLQRLRNQYIDSELARSMQKMNQPETAEEEKINLLRAQQELRAQKRQPIATSSFDA